MDLAISTNIDQVLASVKAFAKGAPFAGAVFGRMTWRERVRNVAQKALYRLAHGPEQEAMVPLFVRTVTVALLGKERMVWAMEDGRVKGGLGSAADLMALVEGSHAGDLFHFAAKADRKTAWELIKDWVTAGRQGQPGGKRIEGQLQGRDEGLSDQEIATNIFMILFGPERGKVADARVGLVRALGEFLKSWVDEQKKNLTDEQVEEWLGEVLQAWTRLVEEEVAGAVAEECGREWARR